MAQILNDLYRAKKIVSKYKIGVLGCGAWGTTIAKMCAENGHDVTVWTHTPEIAEEINSIHENTALLKGIQLPESLKASPNLSDVCNNSDAFIFAIASPYLDAVKDFNQPALKEKPMLSVTKAFLSEEKGYFVTKFLEKHLGVQKLAIMSGPNLASEIAMKKPAASVIASEDDSIASMFQDILSNDYFRIYRSNDVTGVECGGILKNIIAIASGCIDGLGFGENTKAALVTRGIQEMIRFGMAFGASEKTFYGLSGFGDLLATCNSDKSRNWRVGYQFSQGKSLEYILTSLGAVAEGVYTTKVAYPISKSMSLELPITSEVYKVLFEGKDPKKSIKDLMNRDLKPEQ
ncbi:glycerol-3-phosphate dehydrogenase [Candidatus Marinamargulisbacteria bacterium SCGC AAA071-K20]|nr:glycerol-3-phosphate dehydrogenase [Candidatus Marinamargulisbacteria bacterium SCGC AAA071-K20]